MRRTTTSPVRRVMWAGLAVLLVVAGCSTDAPPATAPLSQDMVEAVEPVAGHGSLPVLAELSRTPAEAGTVRFRTAADTLGNQAADDDGTALVFDPDWPLAGSGGNRTPAWSGYGFNLADYSGEAGVHVKWATGGAPEPGNWYLGLSNFATGTWDWVTGGPGTEYGIPGFADFSDGVGSAYVVVVVLGTADCRLEWLRIGGNLEPLPELTAGLITGPAPLETTFDAAGSTDPDGTVTGYEWDLDGDGEYSETGAEAGALGSATADYTFEAAGSYNPAVRVTDEAGATAVRSISVDVADSAQLETRSWGGAGEEVINAVLAGPDGNLYLAGSTTGFGQGQRDVLVLKYSAEGALLWGRTWGAVGEDHAAAMAFKAPDTLYVAGKTTIPDGGEVALVLEYGTDGTWRDTIVWGTC